MDYINIALPKGRLGEKAYRLLKNSGIEFAFIRIGYRGDNGVIYKDDNADYNIQQAQRQQVVDFDALAAESGVK